MKRQIIIPATGLLPHRPYSPAVKVGETLYLSGHTGSDAVTREFPPDIRSQTFKAFENLKALIEAAGGRLSDIAKVNIFMTNMPRDFEDMNDVFRQIFPTEPPARTTVGVDHLARPGLLVEIEAVAILKNEQVL